jgi:uncharacterized membrane protein
MSAYLWVKLLHILSATVLFGTGLGTAFFMFRAYRSKNENAMAVTLPSVVLADWLFTTPAVAMQLATGLWLTNRLNIAFDSVWFVTVIGLFVFVGACWIPVVWIQVRIRNLIAAGARRDEYAALMRVWIALGVPAFSAVLLLFYLMVTKEGAYG